MKDLDEIPETARLGTVEKERNNHVPVPTKRALGDQQQQNSTFRIRLRAQ